MKHIAIMREPYYSLILSGKKTIESRFSKNRCIPYEKVKVGDVIYFKKTGCDVNVTATIDSILYYELNPEKVEKIRIKYGKQIGTDEPKDWKVTKSKKYCSLFFIKDVKQITPFSVPRSNGAGWLLLQD